MITSSTYKVTYTTILHHPEIGDYYGDTDYVRVTATSPAGARRRVLKAAKTAGIRIKTIAARNEDAAYERRTRTAEARRNLVRDLSI